MADWDIRDNPARVGDPESPGAPYCDVCGESIVAPYYDCDGYLICDVCAQDAIRDTRKAPGWFVDWVEFMLEDFQTFEFNERG